MAVRKVSMYTVICDNCKINVNKHGEFYAWSDSNCAEEVAMESEWLKVGNKHYCRDCYDYDEDECLEIDTERKDKYFPPAVS